MGLKKKSLVLWLLWSCLLQLAAADRQQPATFSKIDFSFEGRQAFLKVPEQPLPGKPWVWRAYFPSWHTEIDNKLLDKGYHVAYVNTSDMFGAPEAMAVWDRFYAYLIQNYGLAQRVVLEGVSRGGLYVHTWAKRNPTKVACIYAEVPVCDFSTWPKQISTKDWELLKKSYRFASDEEALAYPDMPIHRLEGLADLGVPILHSICNTDKIVPPEKNSMTFGRNYLRAGGPYGAIPMDKVFNVKTMKGHHFHLERVDEIVSFIYTHSYPVVKMLASDAYHKLNGTYVLKSKVKAEKDKEVNIVFLGGSITYNPGWRNHLEAYFTSRFPDTKLNFLAAGIPSLGSVAHAFRYQRDVLDHMNPDILFYEAAVNDRGNGYAVAEQQKAIEGIIRATRLKNPNADIIMMHFAEPDKMKNYDAGQIPTEIQAHNGVASHYGIPVIDLSREIYDRIKQGEFTWKDDFKELHPSRFGQEYYSQSMKTLLDTLLLHTPADYKLSDKTKLPKPLYKNNYDRGCYMPMDHTTGSFRWVEKYVPDNGQPTRQGYTGVPMLVGEKAGDKMTYVFSGRAIGICLISGNDAGVIRYRVDKKPYKTLDLYTRHSGALHLPRYWVLDDELRNGKHTLELEILPERNGKSKGNACRIVHFLVNR